LQRRANDIFAKYFDSDSVYECELAFKDSGSTDRRNEEKQQLNSSIFIIDNNL